MASVALQIFRFVPVSIFPPVLHTHRHLHVALTKKPRNLPESNAVSDVGSMGQKIGFSSCFCHLAGLFFFVYFAEIIATPVLCIFDC